MFILIEGIDGIGKTTLCEEIRSALLEVDSDRCTFVTKEPFGQYRKTLKNQQNQLTNHEITNLFMDCRIEHQKLMEFCKKNEQNLICDRYVLSNMAYQSEDKEIIFEEFCKNGNCIPDLTIYLSGKSFRKMKESDRFESLNMDKIANNFESLYEDYKEMFNIVKFDRENSKNEEIIKFVLEKYKEFN